MTLGARIKAARKAANFADAAEAARALNIEPHTYRHYEADRRVPDPETLALIARKFGRSADYLLTGRESRVAPVRGLPVVGKVGAGAEAFFEDDYEMGGAYDFLEPPPVEGRIVVDVDGQSMFPRFRHGERLVFGPRVEDPMLLIGQEVMARLADGRKLVKILRRGSRAGRYTLYSYNSGFDPIEDVELLWVLPFESMHTR